MLTSRVCTLCGKRKRVSLDPSKSEFDRFKHRPADKLYGWRSACKKCHARYSRERRRTGAANSREYVPIGPFAEWVRKWVSQNHYCYVNGKPAGGVVTLAKVVGVDESRVRAIMTEKYKRIDLSVVDRYLIATNSDTQIWELYPDY